MHSCLGLSIKSSKLQGVAIQLHAESSGGNNELVGALRQALAHIKTEGRGLQR